MDFKHQRLLIISPHLDDEIIGCGGLIFKAEKDGAKVFVLFLTNSDTNDFSEKGNSTGTEREVEVENVAKFMGYDDYDIVFKGDSYHLKLDHVPQFDLISAIETKSRLSLERVRPTIVLCTHPDSYNQDHRAAAFAAFTACRPSNSNLKHCPNAVLSYESPADQWNLEKILTPNFFLKLSAQTVKKKLDALRLYKSQFRSHPNPRSLQSLKSMAILRGVQCGHYFAEGFYSHRFVI